MNNTALWIAIAITFVLNLIITIVLRMNERKSKALKVLKDNIQSFRSEVGATVDRIRTDTLDAVNKVDQKRKEAEDTIQRMKETLDLLFVHSKELNDLEEVCNNYRIALQKLKIETEQAEARITDVKMQVAEAEKIREFADKFQEDAENTINKVQDQRSEMARFVASSEQNLKAMAHKQESENEAMLASFKDELDKEKQELEELSEKERTSIELLSSDFETKAKEILESTIERVDRIEENLGKTESKLNAYRDEGEALSRDFNLKAETLSGEIDQKISLAIEDIKSASEERKNSIEETLREKEDEVSKAIDDFSDRLSYRVLESQKRVDEIEKKSDQLIDRLSNEIDKISSKAKRVLADDIESAISKSDEEIKRIRESSKEILDKMSDTASQSVDSFDLIQRGTGEKIEETLETLQGLKGKIVESQNELSRLSEELIVKKEELWKEDKKKGDLSNELKKLRGEIQDAEEEFRNTHSKRIKEEAKLVELKMSQKEVEKIKGESVEKAKKPQERIEVYSDEDFSSEDEDIDLSDD